MYMPFYREKVMKNLFYKKHLNIICLIKYGWQLRDDTQHMKMADIFVFPRMEYPKEGLGLVVVEAQAAGCQ